MLLAAESIASGLEGNMSWGMRHFRGMSPARPLAGSFFEELTSSQDVLFAGVFGPSGEVLLTNPTPDHGLPPPDPGPPRSPGRQGTARPRSTGGEP